jgi:hypothetical protein
MGISAFDGLQRGVKQIMENDECCRRSFGVSLIDTAKRLFDNPKLAPRSVAAERLETCKACDHYKKDTTQCDICQCFMPIKTSFANVECPLDKWGAYNEN